MSSRDEKKAKAMKRLQKRQVRLGSKRKRSNNENDDSSDSDGNDKRRGFLPTPRELNDLMNSRGQDKSSKKKKARLASKDGGKKTPSEKFNLSLPSSKLTSVSSHELKLNYWTGPVGEEAPSEELKALRKTLGVNVKGNLALCPPPIASLPCPHLPSEISSTLSALEFPTLTPVQQQCLPAALSGSNLLAISTTGSGKTYAYGLPMIPHILHHTKICPPTSLPSPIALVLVPTRELAIQVSSAFKIFNKLFSIRSVALYGGNDKETQIESMTSSGHSPQVIVATPGRLIDLLQTKHISLFRTSFLVLDEADRMLALGFVDQLNYIAALIRSDRQTLLFSATFPGKLREAAGVWLKDPTIVRCSSIELSARAQPSRESSEQTTTTEGGDDKNVGNQDDDQVAADAEDLSAGLSTSTGHHSSVTLSPSITQVVHVCATHKKPRLLLKCIAKIREEEKAERLRQPGSMLIFCTKIKTLKFVEDFLKRQKIVTAALHGQLPQAQRERTLNDFKAGKLAILCATDVAARGIHIKRLKYVINYDFPSNLEQYCHRVGRTGRQGEKGSSFSFFTRNLAPMAADLVKLLQSCGQDIEPNLLALSEEFGRGNFDETETAEGEECREDLDGDSD